MIGVELDAKGLKTENVHIDLTGTKIATARHGNLGASKAAEQRAHDSGRGTHLGNKLIRSFPGVNARGIDDKTVLVHHFDSGAHTLEDLAHHVNV